MKDGGQYIVLTHEQLDALLERAVARGVKAARTPFVSLSQAERDYGRSVIRNLIERGLIVGHRQGAAANSKVLFGRDEIERAIMG